MITRGTGGFRDVEEGKGSINCDGKKLDFEW